MNNQTLVIYDLNILYQILKEIEDNLNFALIKIDKNKIEDQNVKNKDNILIISKKKLILLITKL